MYLLQILPDMTKEKTEWREQLERLMKIPRPSRIISPPQTEQKEQHMKIPRSSKNTSPTQTESRIGKSSSTYNVTSPPTSIVRQKRKTYSLASSQSTPLVIPRKSYDSNLSLRLGLSSQNGSGSDLLQQSSKSKSVPDCLNTFSDFFSPAVPANDRFELYLKELTRQEKATNIEQLVKAKLKRDEKYYGASSTWGILPDISSSRSLTADKTCSPVEDGHGGYLITSRKFTTR